MAKSASVVAPSSFTPAELRKLRSLKNPQGIQKFIDDMDYHLEDTAWSPRLVLQHNSSHCLEGAMFAAAALWANGYPPLIIDFEAEHDTDHVIAATESMDTGERLPNQITPGVAGVSLFIAHCANWR